MGSVVRFVLPHLGFHHGARPQDMRFPPYHVVILVMVAGRKRRDEQTPLVLLVVVALLGDML